MRFHRFLRLATVTLVAATVGYPNIVAQTSTNTNNANPPANSQGRVVVVPPSGDAKIIGSTVPAAAMPREEPLGDAARRLKKKKKKKSRKAQQRRAAAQPRPQL